MMIVLAFFALGVLISYLYLRDHDNPSNHPSNNHVFGGFNQSNTLPSQQSQQPQRYEHPVLNYQYNASYMTHPANYGDPIRPPPSRLGPSDGGNLRHVYDQSHPGPSANHLIGVPVPNGSIKPNYPGGSYPVDMNFGYPVGGYVTSMGYGQDSFPRAYPSNLPVTTPFEISGVIVNSNKTMNLLQRPIAPNQDLFEYAAQTPDGMIIPLDRTKFLENGDLVHVPGQSGMWKYKSYYDHGWSWM